jgi:uncharacterized protein (TIGR00251 family)
MADLKIQVNDDNVVFTTKVVPGSSGKTQISGLLDGMLKVRVSAPPEKGKANQCLLNFLAKQLAVKKNSVSIISGQTSPVKNIRISGISADMLLKKLQPYIQDS